MDNEDKLIYQFLGKLIKSPADPGELHICPICHGKIHVWFGGYRRGTETLFGATVKCESCGINMAIDYEGPPPSWVQVG